MDAPRRVPAMILAPGNRADVALRCDIETEPGVYKMKSVSRGRYFAPINPNAEDQYEQADPNVSQSFWIICFSFLSDIFLFYLLVVCFPYQFLFNCTLPCFYNIGFNVIIL